MNTIDGDVSGAQSPANVSLPPGARPLHRIGDVRRRQGVTRRTVARHMNIDIAQVKQQEDQTTDMPLSDLYEWQRVLDVPVAELLVEAGDPLSTPVLKRAQLVRLMKTILAIQEQTHQTPVRRMCQTLIEQMTEIMPELEGVGPWHSVGKRRRRDDYGVAAERCLSEDMFVDYRD